MQLIKKIFLSLTLIGTLGTASYAETVFTYAVKSAHHNMDPMSLYDVPTPAMGANIYDGLVGRNDDMQIVPGLAESWENISELVWRFKLRQNVKFHQGEKFTADDVVFSFARASSKNSDIKGAVSTVEKIVKIDDFTVDVHTRKKDPVLLTQVYSMPIFCKSWAEKHKATAVADITKNEEGYADRHTNGTGPFMLKSYKSDIETVLVKNPNWWGGPENVKLDKVIVKPIQTDSVRMAGLLSGELDMIAPVPLQDVKRAKTNPNLKLLETEGMLTVYLGMNQSDDKLKSSKLKKNPFKDVRVRKAFYKAINVDGIVKKIMRGHARVTGSMVAPKVNGYDKALDARHAYDLGEAKKLMAEAGYPNGFKLVMNCTTDRYTKDEMICQAVAQMLKKINVDVHLVAETKSKFFQKALQYDVDFFMMGWVPSTFDAHDIFYNKLMTRKNKIQGNFNVGGYSNPKMDALIDKVAVEMDVAKRNAMIAEAAKIVHEDAGIIPLHQEKFVWGVQKKWSVKIRPDEFMLFKDVK